MNGRFPNVASRRWTSRHLLILASICARFGGYNLGMNEVHIVGGGRRADSAEADVLAKAVGYRGLRDGEF